MARLETPPGFIHLETALDTNQPANRIINVIGAVIDNALPKKSRGTDFMHTFNLFDTTTSNDNTGEGLKVRLFKPSENLLPQIGSIGDIVMIKSLKMTRNPQYGAVAISSSATEIVLFHRDKIPDISSESSHHERIPCDILPGSTPPTLTEQRYVAELKKAVLSSPTVQGYLQTEYKQNWTIKYAEATGKDLRKPALKDSHNNEENPASKSKAIIDANGQRINYDPRFRLVKDVGPDQFVDLVGEVVKIYSSQSALDLYITDYTSNSMLYDHKDESLSEEASNVSREGDEYGYINARPKMKWIGPLGTTTIAIALWPPHSYFASHNVKEGDFVYVRNVHTRLSRAQKLEGVLHEDRRFPDKVDIRVLSLHDPKVGPVKQLRKKYFQSLEETKKKEATKRTTSNKDRRNSKKKKAQEKAQEKAEAEQKYRDAQLIASNKHITCGYQNIKHSTICEILDSRLLTNKSPGGEEYSLPFLNAKYRAHVRVVDYFPHDLQDFSHSLSTPKYNDIPREKDEDEVMVDLSNDQEGDSGWEWAFYLLIEDAKPDPGGKERPRLKLLVAADGAQFLLKMDASDLRKNPQNLNMLKEKLFILWGNLEELKSASAAAPGNEVSKTPKTSSNSFECCIQEYGVLDGPDPGNIQNWKRVHRMFGTTVM